MKVKERYSHFSEQLMYEWTQEKPTAYNHFKRQAYAFWVSVRFDELEWLTLEEQLRIDKIQDLHDAALGARRGTAAYRRARR